MSPEQRELFATEMRAVGPRNLEARLELVRAIEQAAAREAVERIEALKRDHITGSSGCTNANCDFVAAWDDAIRALRSTDTGDQRK